MRATSLPSLDAKVSTAEAGRMKREIMVNLLNRKGDWLDHHLKKILPRDIYRMAHATHGTEQDFEARQAKVKKWLDSHDIRIEEHGICVRLFRGKELISQFLVKLAEE